MTITLNEFLGDISHNIPLLAIVILTLAVIFVNGWHDAPNAIATCVATRAMDPLKSIIMAAIFNFLGVLIVTMINAAVAETIFKMVDFQGDSHTALIAFCAAMVAIVVWGVGTWYIGMPSSTSHALIAGISGAAIALQGGLAGINGHEWMKVVYGLLLSTFLGFGIGFGLAKLINFAFRSVSRHKATVFFDKAQIGAGAGMAFMHGAQDGQKFLGIFMIGILLSKGQADAPELHIPLWLMVVCSLTMAIGTSIGGYRIIKAVAMDMVRFRTHQGFAASLAGIICLVIATITGLPVSTTHTKTTAIMGVGSAHRISSVNWKLVSNMLLTWAFTFPGCGILGFAMALIFMKIF
jgi:PiT family inorganic phosphate transporter